ncbi:hypothetical protein F1C58_03340 [Glaciihabitans sp. INWT7]|nr:hypothetical protein F1C58_03340 [Glaciihabitans sp. INWT7]
MESRTHSRTISPEESAELEELVFDLVRERLLKAVGAGGMWTLQFRASTDTDSLFGETISEYIARDIADQIAAPRAAVELAEVGPESVEDAQTPVLKEMAVEEEITVESVDWSTAPAPAEADVVVVDDQHDEHRMFKPRKAA